MKPQTQEVLALMRAGWVSPLGALDALGCFRLAARVREIRRAGHDVETRDQTTPDGKRFREYRIKRGPAA